MLRPGGVLVLGDLFSFQSKGLNKLAFDADDRWLRKQFHDPDEPLRPKLQALGKAAPRLYKEWVEHRARFHVCVPDLLLVSPTSSSERLSSPSHASMVLDAGFVEVGLPFRLWETGILWARR
jgi:hypothetical protein